MARCVSRPMRVGSTSIAARQLGLFHLFTFSAFLGPFNALEWHLGTYPSGLYPAPLQPACRSSVGVYPFAVVATSHCTRTLKSQDLQSKVLTTTATTTLHFCLGALSSNNTRLPPLLLLHHPSSPRHSPSRSAHSASPPSRPSEDIETSHALLVSLLLLHLPLDIARPAISATSLLDVGAHTYTLNGRIFSPLCAAKVSL